MSLLRPGIFKQYKTKPCIVCYIRQFGIQYNVSYVSGDSLGQTAKTDYDLAVSSLGAVTW